MLWSWTLTWPLPSGEAEQLSLLIYKTVNHPTCGVAASIE